ncbi:MAG TPA: Hsp20/alpha crystallin family protein [Burkholderiales bacterium]|nr:Hsp20/alpha crystallin family protein [Burkholderiales bacterium]
MNELARWDPFQSVTPFGDSVFGSIFPGFFRTAASTAWQSARMDVAETEKTYEFAIDLPGYGKDSIKVSVHENTLTIEAEPAGANGKGDQANWLVRERPAGKVWREIQLPEAVDENTSQAKYVDGVLYLSLQKKRAQQVKRLTVH